MSTAVSLSLAPAWLQPNHMLSDYGELGIWLATLVIFAECGLLAGFFLPGDSLLFTVGLFVAHGDIHHPLWLVCAVLAVAAFGGNCVGYEIGRGMGTHARRHGRSAVFKPEHLERTMEFFAHHGPRAVIMARFVPIVRTFIPVTAGLARMERRGFLGYSAIGDVLWIGGVTLLGRLLGQFTAVRDNVELVVLLVVVVSALPVWIEIARRRIAGRRAAARAR